MNNCVDFYQKELYDYIHKNTEHTNIAKSVDLAIKLAEENNDRIDFLDLGCGNGRHSLEALRRGARVVAVDRNKTALKNISKFSNSYDKKSFSAIESDMYEWMLKEDKSYDVIVCFDAVHHLGAVDKINHFLTLCMQSLNAGGYINFTILSDIKRFNASRCSKGGIWNYEQGVRFVKKTLTKCRLVRQVSKKVYVKNSLLEHSGTLQEASYSATRTNYVFQNDI